MSDLKKTIKERQAIYGDYTLVSKLRIDIMSGIKEQYYMHNGYMMTEEHSLAITDIVNKLCRLAVSPDHVDSWHDIAGYATIIEKYYKSKEKEDANQ